jgi:hypothetical protein
MKLRPVGAQSFHAERRTYTTMLPAAFRKFTNASKNGWSLYSLSYKTSTLTSQFSIVLHRLRKQCATEFLTHFYGHLILPQLPSWKLVNCGTEHHCSFSSVDVEHYSKYALTYTEVSFDECLKALVLSQGIYRELRWMDRMKCAVIYRSMYCNRSRGPAGLPPCVPFTKG